MRNTLKEIRNYVLPSTKEFLHEDLIPNVVAKGEATKKMPKLYDVLRVEIPTSKVMT